MTGLERRNLEIKAVDRDPEGTRLRCAELEEACPAGTLRQRDTYFRVEHGRLKLREQIGGDAAELIYYERPSESGVRTSRYWRTAVPAPSEVAEILGRANGVVGVVEKTRRLVMWRNARIHLDDVSGLGSFVELEIVHAELRATKEDRAAVDLLLAALAIDESDLEPRGYLELMSVEAVG